MFWMNGYLYFKDQPLHDAHPDSLFLLNIIIIKIYFLNCHMMDSLVIIFPIYLLIIVIYVIWEPHVCIV